MYFYRGKKKTEISTEFLFPPEIHWKLSKKRTDCPPVEVKWLKNLLCRTTFGQNAPKKSEGSILCRWKAKILPCHGTDGSESAIFQVCMQIALQARAAGPGLHWACSPLTYSFSWTSCFPIFAAAQQGLQKKKRNCSTIVGEFAAKLFGEAYFCLT